MMARSALPITSNGIITFGYLKAKMNAPNRRLTRAIPTNSAIMPTESLRLVVLRLTGELRSFVYSSHRPTLCRVAAWTLATAVAAGTAPAELGIATVALVHIHVGCAPAIGFAATGGAAMVVCHVFSPGAVINHCCKSQVWSDFGC